MIKYFKSNYISIAIYIFFPRDREVLVAKPDDPSSIPESDMAEVDFYIIPVK